MKILPLADRLRQRKHIEAPNQTQKADVRVGFEGSQQFGDEPAHLKEHVVVPDQEERRTGFLEAPVVAPDLIDVVLVHPSK